MKNRKRKDKIPLWTILDRVFFLDTNEFVGREKMSKKEEEAFWNEKEWTIGKILMRITVYGFLLLWLLVGYLIFTSGDAVILLFGSFPFFFGSRAFYSFIRSDIQILREKSRIRKSERIEATYRK